ncbi:metal-dependent hydrolase [Paenibacillus doosanensis]|uniref:metal-dependent hydrolase n=1 Tax=Paenibacillus doosanensis TaxID=1229154 RepID=UPI0021806862|nr:metal-dependent hydrolase [Paenibacillus doosanensis]MCS7461148.1 metal-dependent hydrolase [Paenibacillus doosanensis]
MDTGSHLLFGATLAGLAMLEPAAAQQPELTQAILTATLIGSHAPDIDSIARLKGYPAYIRFHRGVTHSLPALLVWPLILTVPIASLFHIWDQALYVLAWSFIAVAFHVLLDWLNVYGVQCFRPLSKRWHHLDILPVFDPALFLLHGTGLLVWWLAEDGFRPGVMFAWIYAATAVYIAARAAHHDWVVKRVRAVLGKEGICQVMPGMHWFRWQFVMETDSHFYTGTLLYGDVCLKDEYAKGSSNAVVQATMAAGGVRAFLYFAERVHVSCTEQPDGYVVQWRDVRFWYNHRLPFGVDVRLDRNLNVREHTLGWRKKMWDPPFV